MASEYRGFIADALNESVDYAESFRALSGDAVVCTDAPGGIEISLIDDTYGRRVPAPGDVVRYVRPQGSSSIVFDYLVLLPSIPGVGGEYNALTYVDGIDITAVLSNAYSDLGAGELRWWRVSCSDSGGWLCVKVDNTDNTWSFSFISDSGDDNADDGSLYYPLCYIPAVGAPIVNHNALAESPRVPIDKLSVSQPVDEEMTIGLTGFADASLALEMTGENAGDIRGMHFCSLYEVWNEETWAYIYYNEMRYLAAGAFLDIGDGSSITRVEGDTPRPYLRIANIEDDGAGLDGKNMLVRVPNKFGGYTLGYYSADEIFNARDGGTLMPRAHYWCCTSEPAWSVEPTEDQDGVYEPYVATGDNKWAPLRDYLSSGSEVMSEFDRVVNKVRERMIEQQEQAAKLVERYNTTIAAAVALLNQWLAIQSRVQALRERVEALEDPEDE